MKILKTYDFISERMKFKPVTNTEWEQAKKDIENLKNLSFTKDCITCGTIVMFRDKTFGVYVDGDIAKEIREHFRIFEARTSFFLCSTSKDDINFTYCSFAKIDDKLFHRLLADIDIVRIYENPLTIDEIKSFETNFKQAYTNLVDMTKSRKYIERK